MVIRQLLKNYDGRDEIGINEQINFRANREGSGAFRIAFQALPGTKFALNSSAGETGTVIEMGPTGIYELGFSRAIIDNFTLISSPDDQSLMMLDILLADGEDPMDDYPEEIGTGDLDLIADSYDKDEGAVILNPDVDNYNLFWNVSGRNLNY